MLFLVSPYFRGWLVLTLIGLGLALWQRRALAARLQSGAPPRLAAWLCLATALTLLSLRATPTGDEPHYLIMTQSLLSDGDFDLRNNYERRDYLDYYPEAIPDPHVTLVGDHWYPVHGIGLPLLSAPFFWVSGRCGVVALLTLMTVAGIRLLWMVLSRAGFEPRAACAAALTAGGTLPLASLSGQVFPEVPAFLLVVLALWAILAPALTKRGLTLLLLCLGLLPWLHPKYSALAASLLLSAALAHGGRGRLRALMLATAVLVLSIAGLAYLSYRWFGVALPGASIMMAQAPFADDWFMPLAAHFLVHPWVGLFGVPLDQQSGLFLASSTLSLWCFEVRRSSLS